LGRPGASVAAEDLPTPLTVDVLATQVRGEGVRRTTSRAGHARRHRGDAPDRKESLPPSLLEENRHARLPIAGIVAGSAGRGNPALRNPAAPGDVVFRARLVNPPAVASPPPGQSTPATAASCAGTTPAPAPEPAPAGGPKAPRRCRTPSS